MCIKSEICEKLICKSLDGHTYRCLKESSNIEQCIEHVAQQRAHDRNIDWRTDEFKKIHEEVRNALHSES